MIVELLLLAILCTQLWSIRHGHSHCEMNKRWLKYMVASHTYSMVRANASSKLGDSTYTILRKLLDDVAPENEK